MPMDYDINPTQRLPGLHIAGMVTRRFLINYPVAPNMLLPLLPPGAEVSTWDRCAWVSACFVNVQHMRPSGIPRTLGMEFNYLIHRTRARLPFPDGVKREAVLVLEPNINRRVFASIGRKIPGVRFLAREIVLTEAADSWNLCLRDRSNIMLYEAEISKASVGKTPPQGSQFSSIQEADRFLLGVSYGGEWTADTGRLRLLAETHDPWETFMATCHTKRNVFLESLTGQSIQADHVITMTHIPHYFALSAVDVKVA